MPIKTNADYAAVTEQTGIYTQQSDLNVGGKGRFKGAAFTAASAEDNQTVFAQGIEVSDIQNHSNYDGKAIAAGLNIGKAKDTNPQANLNGIGYGTDSDSQSSTTKAAVTGRAGQSDVTTATKDSLNEPLENTFDASTVNEELGAQVEITRAFDQERRQIKTQLNKEEKELRDEAKQALAIGDEQTAIEKSLAADKVQQKALLFDGISSALYGPNANGATGYVAKAVSPQVANQIGQYFKKNDFLNDLDNGSRSQTGSPEHLLAHALLGAAVSYATGNDMVTGGLGASAGEGTAILLSKYIYKVDNPSELTAEQKDTISNITTLAGVAIGSSTGEVTDAVNAGETAKVAVEDNYLTEAQDRSYSLLYKSPEFLKKISKENENYLIKVCDADPSSNACKTAIQDSLWYNSESRLRKRIDDGDQSAKRVLNILYNGNNAKNLFISRVSDIDSRANFFGTNDNYYKSINLPIRWFEGAEDVSRSCITGLGASGCASYITFGAGKLLGNPDIYGWRSEAGNTLMKDGYANFKKLYNGQYTNAVDWDVNQLKREQTSLQPVHEKYLKDKKWFRLATEKMTDVDILDKDSRIKFGCELLGYDESQGCKP